MPPVPREGFAGVIDVVGGIFHVLHEGDGFAVGVEQAIDNGQENQQIGAEEVGDLCGDEVVVAEADFGDGDGIVFVDDGNDAVAMLGVDAIAEVEVAAAVFKVGAGDEDLADVEVVGTEGVGEHSHEDGLADGGGGLEEGQFFGAFGEAQFGDARADGAGGDHGDLDFAGLEGGDLLGEVGDEGGIEVAGGVGKGVGADFDDDGADAAEEGGAIHICGGNRSGVLHRGDI